MAEIAEWFDDEDDDDLERAWCGMDPLGCGCDEYYDDMGDDN